MRAGRAGRTAAVGMAMAAGTASVALASTGPPPGARALFTVESPEIAEASGIATDSTQRLVFLEQDAGRPPVVHAIDLTGRTRARIEVPFPNEDWEDLATGVDEDGRPALFIADTGDAFFVRRDQGLPPRTEFALIRIREPVVQDGDPTDIPAVDPVRWPLVYADGGNHNAETLLVQPGTGRVFLVDKSEEAGTPAYLWMGPDELTESGPNVLERVSQVPVTSVSSGSFSPTGDRLALRDADTAYVWRVADGDVAGALTEPPVISPLPSSPQGEGLAFSGDGNAVLTSSEGGSSVVWQVPLPADARTEPVEAAPVADEVVGPGAPTGVRPLVLAGGVTVLLLLAGAGRAAVHLRRRYG